MTSLCSYKNDATRHITLRPHGQYWSTRRCVGHSASPVASQTLMEDPPEDIQMNPSAMLATPDPTAGSSAATRTTGKRKRTQPDLPEDEPEASSSRAKKSRTVVNYARRAPKPKRPSDWHLKKGDIPADASGTKVRSCVMMYTTVISPSFLYRLHLSFIYVLSGAFHTRMRSHLLLQPTTRSHLLGASPLRRK